MLKKLNQRHSITGFVILLYVTTVLLMTLYNKTTQGWNTLAFDLFLGMCGSLASLLVLLKWENSIRESLKRVLTPLTTKEDLSETVLLSPESQPYNFLEMTAALSESQAKHLELIGELNKSNDQLHRLEVEKNQFQQRIDDIYREFNSYKSSTEEELERKTVLLTEYQETINQQREVLKRKQDQIIEHESKIHDLNYEVKTLLQLADYDKETVRSKEGTIVSETSLVHDIQMDQDNDSEYFPMLDNQVKTPEEASAQLKRCVDIAQKISGATHFNTETSRFKDLPIDNVALDMRRLFDSLRSENVCTVIVYSQKENKILFANNQAKSLLGWSVERFVQNFQEIIYEGDQEWKKGISQLATFPESRVRLLLKTKSSQNLLVHCHLGIIPRGTFRNHIIGILYPA
jgi:PAS domain-containing protein